ncbi:hypothetical protein MRX96_004541 [Rhipicephalus microplus]
MRPDPPWRELQADPVCQLRGPSLCRHPRVPSVAGAAEDCHNHGILPNNPLEAHSGSSSARGDSGGADLCKRGEGPPRAAPPPARPIPAPRKSRRQPLQGLQSTSAAAPMALPVATAVPEAPPAEAATLAAQPAAIAPRRPACFAHGSCGPACCDSRVASS